MKDTFYVTSAIYYVNDAPHVGHTYEIVACDVIARYHRLRGEKVFFLTGTDEHSQNVVRAGAERGMSPQDWTDEIVPKWRSAFDAILVSNDDFIRTSEQRHVERVQRFLGLLYDRGEVYLGSYEGWYCVSCEEFKVEGDLVDGNCRIHQRPVELISEDNYFFRLSNYQDRLLRLYEQNRTFVAPDIRRNEVVSFVKSGLRDLSISRAAAVWGIPLPWDEKHITYVWVDALLNYITAPGFGADDQAFSRVWPADVHVVGKDITRFHAVIWPAMLMAADLPLPRRVFAHGFVNLGGEKMSKTRGTGMDPFQLLQHFGVDSYRWYFLREVPFGQDGSFSWEGMVARHNADLANGLGNLASRVLAMTASYFDGLVPEPRDGAQGRLAQVGKELAARFDRHMEAFELTEAAGAVAELIREANRWLVEESPWNLAKDRARRQDLAEVLYEALEALRLLAVLSSPIMPRAAAELWAQLGVDAALSSQTLPAAAEWGLLSPGARTTRGPALFPRLEE